METDPFREHPLNAAGFREPPPTRPWPSTDAGRKTAAFIGIAIFAIAAAALGGWLASRGP